MKRAGTQSDRATESNCTTSSWSALADAVLDGHRLTTDEALAIVRAPDDELLDLLAAAYRIRRRHWSNRVQLYFLMNAKSGLCPEDCGYCSQSKVSEAEIPQYNILSRQKLLDGARVAYEQQAKSYCIVISSRSPSDREMNAITTVVPEIKQKYNMEICTSLGLLSPEQARRLKAAGVDKVNHNLNTSARYYQEICSTHTYQDRLDTLRAVREAGMELCCGGIIGMGEGDLDIVQMAEAVREYEVESIPLNFLISIDGTPLAHRSDLNPRYCLKVLCMFRFMNPSRELRISGGREVHLRSLQPLGLYAANSIFVGDYLTTKGQAAQADYEMLADLGFSVELEATAPPSESPVEPVAG